MLIVFIAIEATSDMLLAKVKLRLDRVAFVLIASSLCSTDLVCAGLDL